MIVDIVRHTPPWVFLVLAALIALGVRRLRPTDIAPRQLLILPLVMTALSLFGLWQVFGASLVVGAVWLAFFAACLAIGWTLPAQAGVQYSCASRRIHVPGSAWPLVLMMTIFLLRYAVAVNLAMHPALRVELPFAATVAALYGLSSGAFAARALRTWRSAFFSRAGASPLAPVAA